MHKSFKETLLRAQDAGVDAIIVTIPIADIHVYGYEFAKNVAFSKAFAKFMRDNAEGKVAMLQPSTNVVTTPNAVRAVNPDGDEVPLGDLPPGIYDATIEQGGFVVRTNHKVYNPDESPVYAVFLSDCEEFYTGDRHLVKQISMGQSSTSVLLKGFNKAVNSVRLKFYENGAELDIYKDPRFNPYLGLFKNAE